MLLRLILIGVAYLLGSVPSGYLLVKYIFTSGEDVRNVGSGATGATNVARRAGLAAGVITYVLDMAKGMAAVLLVQSVAGSESIWDGAAAFAVIAGHIFPIFLGFRGGKGVATGAGAFVLLAPYAVLSALIVWALAVYLTRYVSVGSILGTASLPFWTLIYYGLLPVQPEPQLGPLVVMELASSALIISKHHQNISRLLHGTENKIGTQAPAPK
jgi:acyl phosphate:glycerol-3-phosphate acyltransferase